ncbi:MAG: glycosyltransferase family 2 protein [Flavobacterium sp.]
MNVYILIVTYNAKPWIQKCLESALTLVKANFILVVDNHSTDDTVAWIQNNFPQINLISLTNNLGFGQANNIGMAKALELGADAVFLMNQDVYLTANTLEALWLQSQQHPEYGILSPMHYNGTGTALDANFSNYIVPSKCPGLYSDALVGNYQQSIYPLPFVNAAAWLVTKACLEKVGGFNPSFFHYGEDDNYCQRVIYHGFKIGVVPNTKVLHDREQTLNHSYFKDRAIVEKRKAILHYSNPQNKSSFVQEKKKHVKKVIKSILFLRWQQVKRNIKHWQFLKSLPLQIVISNRELSKQTGTSFLNFNSNK